MGGRGRDEETPSAPSSTERYFRPKRLELDGRLYAWLGVVHFKRGLMRLVQVDPARPTANAYVLGGRSLDHVRAFERKSRRSEAIHLLGLVVAAVLLTSAAAGARPLWIPGAALVVVNLHCFLLQRYNRVRVYRILRRTDARSGGDCRTSSPG